ncbi:response regulator [Candidatus Magnetomonas plexicatena]|nr:response regulator [Nitrospirales bacterium LBB_01]
MADVNILIVEDERIIARDIEKRLKRMGYAVVGIMTTGENAVKTLSENIPDLVLMDIRLKGKIDGIEAANQIRKQYDIPIIFLTAHSDKDTLDRAKVAQPYGYLLKPFNVKDIATTIEISLYKHKMDIRCKQDLKQCVQKPKT